ncbi:MAG: transferase spermidine synthase [Massilia sp.]|nr:transferase spermidine synthase [Massilia sp.]
MPTLPDPSPSPPLVCTRGDVRTLEFMPGNVQSEMRLSRPNQLMLAYSRAIMCFALFVPRPRHIVMVGLGGGSLAKFCYRHFPHARITVLELRADVIALREQFCVPADDARFTVVHADATAWLANAAGSVDVLVVDGFNEAGLPPALGSSRFYADCRRALRGGGVLVANIFSYDLHYPAMLGRLQLMFGGQVCWLDKVAGNNRILFAVKAPLDPLAPRPPGRALAVRRLLGRRQGLGSGTLNRLLVHALVRYLALRRHVSY